MSQFGFGNRLSSSGLVSTHKHSSQVDGGDSLDVVADITVTDLQVNNDLTVTGIIQAGDAQFNDVIVQSLDSFGRLALMASITPTVAANTNNWAPAGGDAAHRWVTTVTGAARTITGIDASLGNGFVDGQVFFIMPAFYDLILADKSASSTAGNRFSCPNAASFTIRKSGAIMIIYTTDNANNPFRVIAP